MGSTLTNTQPKDTYKSLLKTSDSTELSATAKYVSDGNGNDSPLALSTSAVGIGTTSPSAKLQVYENATNSSINVNHAVDSGTIPQYAGISLGATSTDFGGDIRYKGGAGMQSVNTAVYGNETDLRFWTTTGGSPSEKVRILASGGLTFNGDTSANNALSDYEIGTFTPTVAFGGASAGVTYSEQAGKYTKIGRQVTVEFEIVLTSKGSSTGRFQIGNLPFTGIASQFTGAVELRNVTFTQKYAIAEIGRAAGTFFRVILMDSASSSAELTDTGVANDSGFLFSATYFV